MADEQNIYKDHYDLQKEFQKLSASMQNLYARFHSMVAPAGVQLSFDEVVTLVEGKIKEAAEKVVEEVKDSAEK